jgi:hypothetical protein
MPVSLPENTALLTVDQIRTFLRDVPDRNILLDDVEFEDKDINFAITLTLSRYNSMPPLTSVTADYVPLHILLCGVCHFLLNSEGVRQLRNQLTAQDGNIGPVGIDEKEALYQRWADYFKNEFESMAQRYKVSQNMESCYGSLGSGYSFVGRYNS